MKTEAKALGWLRSGVLGVFVLAILGGMYLPVYADEVGWRFQERAGLDGIDKLFNDACGPNTLARPPFFMMPARIYSAFFNTSFADPFYVRLSGVLYAMLWLVLVLSLVRRIAGGPSDQARLTAVGIGLMGIGTMPLLLVWSRPEQPILLAVTAALLLGSAGDAPASHASARATWFRSLGICLLAIVAFSYHVKGVFLAPTFLTCLWFASRGRDGLVPRLTIGALLVAAASWSAHYWIHRLQCPGDPLLYAAYAKNNMGMDLSSSGNFPQFLSAAARIVGNVNLLEYFKLPVPRADPMSDWLEPAQIGQEQTLIWFGLLLSVWLGAVALALVCAGSRAPSTWRERRVDSRLAFAAILLVTVLAWSATQAMRMVYEASFVLPLTMLAVILALAVRRPGKRLDKWVNVLTVIVGVLGLVSPVAIAALYGPSFARASVQQGYLRAQPYSLSAFGYSRVEPDILAAARQCGIGDASGAKALMVDDLTYFAFMKSRLPQHQLGVVGVWKGSLSDPIGYLKGRGSDGIIVGCHLLPENLRRRASRQGGFCCLGPPNW